MTGVQIVDSRGKAGFDSGHIPGSINVPTASLLKEGNIFKSKEEIKDVYMSANVDLQKPCIFSCGGGIMASTPLVIAK